MTDGMKVNFSNNWISVLIQTLVLGGMLWGYATLQERRVTTLEVNVENQKELLEKVTESQDSIRITLEMQARTLERLIALEEFMHTRAN